MKKIIKQHDITDCGAACLASISAHYELLYPIAKIRQMASTDKKGTNVLGMIEAANKLGFTAKGVKGPLDALFKIPKPAIAHVIIKQALQHFVVIYKINKKYIWVMDPGEGRMIRKTYAEFQTEWTGVLIILVPNEQFQSGNKKVSTLSRFWNLASPHTSVITQSLVGAVLYSILGLSTSVFVQKILDYVLVDGNRNLLHLMGIAMLIIVLINACIGGVQNFLITKTGQKMDAALILGYYRHLLSLPQQFFDTMRVGEITSRIGDAIKIRVFISNVAMNLVVNVLIVLFTFALMYIYSWKLALLVTVSIPFFVIIYLAFNYLNKKYLRKIMEQAADLESHLVESLTAIGTIKRFATEQHSQLKTESRFIKLLESSFINAKGHIFSNSFSGLLSNLVTIAILWYGSTKVLDQQLTPGALMSFYALTGYLLAPISSLISSNQAIQDALIAADRLFQIMDLEREQEEQGKLVLTPQMVGDIQIKNISFRYGSRQYVFSDLSLTIERGKMTAFVGESGCGKTTLLSLLQNIYTPQSGIIEIGGYDIKHIRNNSLRKIISVVPQQIDIFSGSIIENISLGIEEPDMEKILTLSKMLEIDTFIEKLPHSYMTVLGEHGVSLSGGERQRLAIARALYLNPEILILDEATSALDGHSESVIKKVLLQLRSDGKTLIIITHRLSSIFEADIIHVLENGRVIESGNHQRLIALQGKYYSFCKHQLLGFENL